MKIGQRANVWVSGEVQQHIREINGKRFMFTSAKTSGSTVVVVSLLLQVGQHVQLKIVRF